MLRYWLTSLSLTALALVAHGETVVADSLYSLTIDTPLQEMIYHLRFRPDKNNDAKISLYWNYIDSYSCFRAEFIIPSLMSLDNTDKAMVDCNIFKITPAGETAVGAYQEAITVSRGRDAAFSAVLRADAAGAQLRFGDRQEQAGFNVPLDRDNIARLAFRSSRDIELVNHILVSRAGAKRERFDGELVFDSADSLTGRWTYLDRNSDPDRVAGAIDYDIAIVQSEDAYVIVYQGKSSDGWRAGDIKGYLRPTPFAGHFDLEWIDQGGTLHRRDVSADLLLDGQVLRLNFPLLGTSIRLRRTK